MLRDFRFDFIEFRFVRAIASVIVCFAPPWERRLHRAGQFPAAALISEIEAQSDLAKQLHDIAGEKFRRLFTTVKISQPAENFRTEAAAILSESKPKRS